MNGKRSKRNPDIATTDITRSSAVEYLTFVAAQGKGGVEVVYADDELAEGSVIRKFRITAANGKAYETQHYNLSAIIAVGYKVNSERAVQFRKWATTVVKEFTVKGFAMDDERLKLHWAIHGHTAAEVIVDRADAEKPQMGLTTWKDADHWRRWCSGPQSRDGLHGNCECPARFDNRSTDL